MNFEKDLYQKTVTVVFHDIISRKKFQHLIMLLNPCYFLKVIFHSKVEFYLDLQIRDSVGKYKTSELFDYDLLFFSIIFSER